MCGRRWSLLAINYFHAWQKLGRKKSLNLTMCTLHRHAPFVAPSQSISAIIRLCVTAAVQWARETRNSPIVMPAPADLAALSVRHGGATWMESRGCTEDANRSASSTAAGSLL